MWNWRKIAYTDPSFTLAQEVRTAVFVEEQGVDAALEYDTFEAEASHYIVFDGEQVIAAARWRITTKGIKLERFAVLPTYRRKGVGKYLVEVVLKEVLPLKQSIYLHAQIQVIPFYQGLGFVKEGTLFEEAAMQHFRMVFKPV